MPETLFAIYGIGFAAMSVSILLLNIHAWRQRERLDLDGVERHETLTAIGVYCVLAGIGAVSAAVALLVPPGMAGVPGWVYMPIPLIMWAWIRHMGSRRPVTAPVPANRVSATLLADGDGG